MDDLTRKISLPPPTNVLLRFIKEVSELHDLTKAAAMGMRSLVDLPSDIEGAVDVDESGAHAWPTFNEDLREAERIARVARRQVERGFRDLYAEAVVTLWAYLELAIDDFAAEWLRLYPQCAREPIVRELKVQLTVADAIEGRDSPRRIIESLKQAIRAKAAPGAWDGVGRFELLLNALGLSGLDPKVPKRPGKRNKVAPINTDLVNNIAELWATRNLIVHHGRRATNFFLRTCPWVPLALGDEVMVADDDYHRWQLSACEYAGRVSGFAAAKASRYEAPPEPAGEEDR